MDVCAVRHGVRVAEALGEAFVERNLDDPLPAHAVEHEHVLDEHRLFLDQAADTEGVERVPGVRRDLNAGADLAEFGRLLEHDGAEALTRQRERRGEAADAAAGDDDRLAVPCAHASSLNAARASGEDGSPSVSMSSKWFRPRPTNDPASRPALSSPAANSRDWRANSAASCSPQATNTGQRMRSIWRIGLYSCSSV